MGINLNDLDNNLNPVGASLLSGNETVLDNLRELSEKELKTTGGGKKGGSEVYIDNGYGGYIYSSGGGKKGGGRTFIDRGYYGGYYGGYGPGYGGINVNVDVDASSDAKSKSKSY